MASVSRRKVLSLGITVSAAALLPGEMIGAPLRFSSKALEIVGQIPGPQVSDFLKAIPVSDTAAVALMEDLFPGLTGDSAFQPFAPVAFLVSNVSDRKIHAFCSSWKLVTPKRIYQANIMHYFHPRFHTRERRGQNTWGRTLLFSGRLPIIEARASRLVTPFFDWGPEAYGQTRDLDWAGMPSRRPKIVLSELSAPEVGVSMNITAAIIDGYLSVGPNEKALTEAFCVARNAEHDEAVSVRNLVLAGATREQIGERLRRDAVGLDFRPDPGSIFYYKTRQRQAAVLLRRLNSSPWDKFLRILEYLRNQPKTLHRTLESSA
jgi:hypothetical protein